MHKPIKSKRRIDKITLYLLVADALIWLAFALIVAAGWHPALPDSLAMKWMMSILAIASAIALPGFYLLARRFGRIWYYLLLALLLLISFLTIADEFGLWDLIVLILHISPLLLLVMNKNGELS